LAGLVGITAPCAFVPPWAAVVIGAIAAPVMIGSVYLVERVLKVDDPVGAVSVHGAGGLWGLLAVGIFADGTFGVSGLLVGDGTGRRFCPVPDVEIHYGSSGFPGRGTGRSGHT
jgi:Amt family ammonium transporter